MLCCRTTRCKNPPIVIVDPTVAFGPSAPHLFLDSLSTKCAWMGKGDVVCVRLMYCIGVMVKVPLSISNFMTFPVIFMYGLVCISPLKGMSCKECLVKGMVMNEKKSIYVYNVSNKCIISDFEVRHETCYTIWSNGCDLFRCSRIVLLK
jgi:hypothetical protein